MESFSEPFNKYNVVKQDVVMPPMLLNIYIMDESLIRLKDIGIGCYFNQISIGAFMYGVDITLLATTSCALNEIELRCLQSYDISSCIINIYRNDCVQHCCRKIDHVLFHFKNMPSDNDINSKLFPTYCLDNYYRYFSNKFDHFC